MAFFTRHDGMQTNQREARQIVVKSYLGAPAFFVMALVTFLALLTFMCIVDFMAAIAVFLHLGFEYVLLVAGSTGCFGMFTT